MLQNVILGYYGRLLYFKFDTHATRSTEIRLEFHFDWPTAILFFIKDEPTGLR